MIELDLSVEVPHSLTFLVCSSFFHSPFYSPTTLLQDEQWSGPPGIETKDLKPKTRLAGADELFLFFKKSIARCASLTTGEVFAKLWREYLSGLTRYCELLEMKVRNREMASVENSATRAESIRVWGLILNTAEYIVDTLPDLANSVKKRVCSKH